MSTRKVPLSYNPSKVVIARSLQGILSLSLPNRVLVFLRHVSGAAAKGRVGCGRLVQEGRAPFNAPSRDGQRATAKTDTAQYLRNASDIFDNRLACVRP